MFFRLAAFSLRVRRSLGFSKCWWRRRSARTPAFSHFFLKRRRALSKDSPSFTLIPGKKLPPLCPGSLQLEKQVTAGRADGERQGAKSRVAVYGGRLASVKTRPQKPPRRPTGRPRPRRRFRSAGAPR